MSRALTQHLTNTSKDSEELELFEPSRDIRRDERVSSDERVVILAQYEFSDGVTAQRDLKSYSDTIYSLYINYLDHLPVAPQGRTKLLELTGSPISDASTCPPRFFNAVDNIYVSTAGCNPVV